MTFSVLAFSMALLSSASPDQEFPAVNLEDLPHQPFVALLEYSGEAGDEDLEELRTRIERARDEELEASRKTEEKWKKALAAARKSLESLNELSSEDTAAAAKRRSGLHVEIAALERGIREKAIERERGIPAKYEPQLTRIWLARHWPGQRAEILRRIREGQSRARRHGDVEDIGYRQLAGDPAEDVEAGEQAARQMIAGGSLPFELQDNDIQLYVRQVAARLAANSDLKIPVRVSVLNSSELKALALPGGYLYVTSGALRAAQTESEFAGVLSREIARIAARHATRRSKASLISRLFVPVAQIVAGVFTGGAVSPAAYYGLGYGIEGLGGLVGPALNGSNEKFQVEADQLGIQYAWKAGYDPRGFIAFLDSISGMEAAFLSAEPPIRERLLRLFSEIQYLPKQKNVLPASEEFHRIKQRLIR